MGGQVLVRKMDGGQVRRFRTGSTGKGYLETHVYAIGVLIYLIVTTLYFILAYFFAFMI